MSAQTPPREPEKPWTVGRVVVAACLTVVCCATFLSLLLTPAISGRRAPRRREAENRGKNLGLATTNYYLMNGAMPPHAEPAGPPAVS